MPINPPYIDVVKSDKWRWRNKEIVQKARLSYLVTEKTHVGLQMTVSKRDVHYELCRPWIKTQALTVWNPGGTGSQSHHEEGIAIKFRAQS